MILLFPCTTKMDMALFLLALLFLHFPLAKFQVLVSIDHAIQGEWKLLHESIGISAMHMQLLHNNQVVIFDRTDFGPSNLSLPTGYCRYDSNDLVLKRDCTAHSIVYNVATDTFRPLMVQTDTWCSSGAVLHDGTLVQTGGYNDGDHVVRTFSPCSDDKCDWVEFPGFLLERRWYASDQILPDGRVIIIGGRAQSNYEFYPKLVQYLSPAGTFHLEFLRETRDESENNLYPFVHLLPDGNLFLFANTRAIVFDYKQNRVVRELPNITDSHPRNYPSSGSSVMLPLDENISPTQIEIMICGGAPQDAFPRARQGDFIRATSTCGRLRITDENPTWEMENMPMPRVMGDMLLLPNGQVIIINGASSGTAGWENARDPTTRPLIYNPNRTRNTRFSVMQNSHRPRLYHSSAILLGDGRILVGGSNPHVYYNFTNVDFPTDLSLEAFSPPYLAAMHAPLKPNIVRVDNNLKYQQPFTLNFMVNRFLELGVLSVRIIAPSFTTHSFSMNQRMVVLKVKEVDCVAPNTYRVSTIGPSTPEIAPPGYYMVFVVHADIPSTAMWVRIST